MRAAVFLLAFAVTGCSMQSSQNATLPASGSHFFRPMDTYGGTGMLAVSLMDAAPAARGKNVAHFYIGVDEVDAIANGAVHPIVSFGSPYVLDLLQYQNGNELSMGQAFVQALNYSQYRLVLNAASTKVVFSDGSSLPVAFKLNSPSQSSAGAASQTTSSVDSKIAGAVDVTVNAPFSVAAGGSATLAGDFNILESLSLNSAFATIRPSMFVARHAGQIRGRVVNSNGAPVRNAVVVAVNANGVVGNTCATDAEGNFNLHALEADTYRLTIYNTYTTASGQSVSASGQTSTAASLNGPTITVTDGGSATSGIIND